MNIRFTNAYLLLKVKVLNKNKAICFNKSIDSTKWLIIKDLAGFWFDRLIYSTKKSIIKRLAGFWFNTQVNSNRIELLNGNRRIAFNNHFNSTIRLTIKGFGGKQLNKHYYSTVRCFIKVLAVFSLISTVVVLWDESLKFLAPKSSYESNKRCLLLETSSLNEKCVFRAV